eukprot:COSAG05_NODE_1981_length_3754_cov_8.506156_4_plen_65_part_00
MMRSVDMLPTDTLPTDVMVAGPAAGIGGSGGRPEVIACGTGIVFRVAAAGCCLCGLWLAMDHSD